MCGEGWPPLDTEFTPRNFLPPGTLQRPTTVTDTEDNPLLSEHPSVLLMPPYYPCLGAMLLAIW